MTEPTNEVRNVPQQVLSTDPRVEAPQLPENVEIPKTVRKAEGLSAFGRLCMVAVGTLIPPLGIGFALGCKFGSALPGEVGFKSSVDLKTQVQEDWKLTKGLFSVLGSDIKDSLYLPKGWNDPKQYQSLDEVDFARLEKDVQQKAITELQTVVKKKTFENDEWKALVKILDVVAYATESQQPDASVLRDVANQLESVSAQPDQQLNREMTLLKDDLYNYAFDLSDGEGVYGMTPDIVKEGIEKVKASIKRLGDQ